MTFPTIAATTTAKEGSYNGSDWTPSLAGLGTISAGDLLIAAATCSVGSQRNYAAPSGWTELVHRFGNSDTECFVWAKIAAGGDGLTLAKGGLSCAGSICVYRITGHYGTSVAASVESTSTSSGAAADPPSLTPTWGSADTKWIAGVSSANSPVSAYPTGYSDSQITVNNDGVVYMVTLCAKDAAASSDNPAAFTVTGFTFAHIWTLAVRPAAGGGGGGGTVPIHLLRTLQIPS